jgi:hypothetical protein
MLITGDRDFAYAAAILRLRQFRVVIVAPSSPAPHISLKSQASVFLDWNADVLGKINRHNPGIIQQGSVERQSSLSRATRPRASSNSTISSDLENRFADRDDNTGSTTSSSRTSEKHWRDDNPEASTSRSRRCPSPTSACAFDVDASSTSSPQADVEDDWISLSPNDLHTMSSESTSYFAHDWIQIRPISEFHNSCSSEMEDNKHCVEQQDLSADEWIMDEATIERITQSAFVDRSDGQTSAPATNTPANPPPVSPSASSALSNDTSSPCSSRPSTSSAQNTSFESRGDTKHVVGEQLLAESPEVVGDVRDRTLQERTYESPRIREHSELDHTPSAREIDTVTPAMNPESVASTSTITRLETYPPSSTFSPSCSKDTPAAKKRLSALDLVTLVDILRPAHKDGIALPTRLSVANLLLKRDPEVYQRSRVKGFGEYADLAKATGFVELGKVAGGESWISLHSDLRTIPLPTDYPVLVDILNKEHLAGNKCPSRSIVANTLQKRDPTVFHRVGITKHKFRRYAALAESAGIVKLGQVEGGDSWISLHPRWQGILGCQSL